MTEAVPKMFLPACSTVLVVLFAIFTTEALASDAPVPLSKPVVERPSSPVLPKTDAPKPPVAPKGAAPTVPKAPTVEAPVGASLGPAEIPDGVIAEQRDPISEVLGCRIAQPVNFKAVMNGAVTLRRLTSNSASFTSANLACI